MDTDDDDAQEIIDDQHDQHDQSDQDGSPKSKDDHASGVIEEATDPVNPPPAGEIEALQGDAIAMLKLVANEHAQIWLSDDRVGSSLQELRNIASQGNREAFTVVQVELMQLLDGGKADDQSDEMLM